MPPWKLQRNVYVPGSSNVCVTAAPPGSRVSFLLQLALVDVTVCETAVWSNSHRTVSPVATVTAFGCHSESAALIVVCACAAVAANAHTATVSSTIDSLIAPLPLFPCNSSPVLPRTLHLSCIFVASTTSHG